MLEFLLDSCRPRSEKTRIRVVYQWKFPACASCQIFGHSSERCPNQISKLPAATASSDTPAANNSANPPPAVSSQAWKVVGIRDKPRARVDSNEGSNLPAVSIGQTCYPDPSLYLTNIPVKDSVSSLASSPDKGPISLQDKDHNTSPGLVIHSAAQAKMDKLDSLQKLKAFTPSDGFIATSPPSQVQTDPSNAGCSNAHTLSLFDPGLERPMDPSPESIPISSKLAARIKLIDGVISLNSAPGGLSTGATIAILTPLQPSTQPSLSSISAQASDLNAGPSTVSP